MPLGKPRQEERQKKSDDDNRSEDLELVTPKFSLDDLIISSETNAELKSLASLKSDHELVFHRMGFIETHRRQNKFIVNFYGEPGTGKTLAAHAFAHEFGKKLLIVDYSQVESKYVGETPKNLKKIFDFAKHNDCLIFFDEADAILSRRVTDMHSSTDTSVNQTRSVLLNILNDFEGNLIFATNFISNYDPAFMRRISKHVFFALPDHECREKLLRKYIPTGQHPTLDFAFLATHSEGLSAADIENATLMAGFFAASKQREIITTEDLIIQLDNTKTSKQHNSAPLKTFTTTSKTATLPSNIEGEK
jgi:ATP-dependent 26S proteasome regulatory subunit